uniref:Uncharacterized protein n=1 Tax=Panagrolaimus davidi TaxID=227884 RepID=A0A914PIV6_9BILA
MVKKIEACVINSVKSASFKGDTEYIYEESDGWGAMLCKRKVSTSLSLADIFWKNKEDEDIQKKTTTPKTTRKLSITPFERFFLCTIKPKNEEAKNIVN